jgi:hypothetical protein
MLRQLCQKTNPITTLKEVLDPDTTLTAADRTTGMILIAADPITGTTLTIIRIISIWITHTITRTMANMTVTTINVIIIMAAMLTRRLPRDPRSRERPNIHNPDLQVESLASCESMWDQRGKKSNSGGKRAAFRSISGAL